MFLSRHSVGTLSGNELTHDSSGNTRSQSSQLIEPLWTNPRVKSEIKCVQTNLHKKFLKVQVGNELLSILSESLQARKKPAITQQITFPLQI